MLMRDQWGWTGDFILNLTNVFTGATRTIAVPNLLTDAGLNWLRDRMQGQSNDWLTEIALGTDSTPASAEQAALFAEIAPRKSVVVSQPETGVSLCDALWDHTEANVRIRELGIFAGTILVARAVVDVTKTGQESLTVTRRDTLKRTLSGG